MTDTHHAHAHGHAHAHAGLPTQRQRNEAAVYDARARAFAEQVSDDDLRLDPAVPPYPNREHVEFLDLLLAEIGDLTGARVLEVGCGGGALSTWLAMQGAEVVGLDVSDETLELARRRAAVNGVSDRVEFRCCPVEDADDADGSFDAVIGNQTLHHLELAEAMTVVRRLLRPGGRAVFAEPVLLLPEIARTVRGSRPVRRFFPERTDTPDERSLGTAELAVVRAPFETSTVHEFQLLGRLQNFTELSDSGFARLERIDRVLLRRLPVSRRLCRYVVLVLVADRRTARSAR